MNNEDHELEIYRLKEENLHLERKLKEEKRWTWLFMGTTTVWSILFLVYGYINL